MYQIDNVELGNKVVSLVVNFEVKPLSESPRVHVVLKHQIIGIAVRLHIQQLYLEYCEKISRLVIRVELQLIIKQFTLVLRKSRKVSRIKTHEQTCKILHFVPVVVVIVVKLDKLHTLRVVPIRQSHLVHLPSLLCHLLPATFLL